MSEHMARSGFFSKGQANPAPSYKHQPLFQPTLKKSESLFSATNAPAQIRHMSSLPTHAPPPHMFETFKGVPVEEFQTRPVLGDQPLPSPPLPSPPQVLSQKNEEVRKQSVVLPIRK
jgi:hypothetical protein